MVVDAMSFALDMGDALVLRGPNGSGKSSLLRLLAGFVRPVAGQVAWQGKPVDDDLPGHRARLHYLGHADAIKGVLTVAENVAFAAALQGGGPGPHAAALEAFALTPLADTPGRLLSAGQRRRTALTRLCASRRPLWLLDEPETGLDRANRDRLQDVIADHLAHDGIVVVATHGELAISDPYVLDLV